MHDRRRSAARTRWKPPVLFINEDLVIKYASLAVLVIQNCSLVLFMHFIQTGKRAKFLKTMSVFWAEVFKLVTSIVLVCIQFKDPIKGLKEIYTEFTEKWRDAAKVLIPAFIYSIQNVLLYVANEHLEPATYMVTYQLKILTTAVFTVLVLKRKLSYQQWGALVALFIGIVVVQYDKKIQDDQAKLKARTLATSLATTTTSGYNATLDGDDTQSLIDAVVTTVSPLIENAKSPIVGFLAVLVASFLSGFSGIYFEKILKGSEVSIWIRNIQLAIPSMFLMLGTALVKDRDVVFSKGFGPLDVVSQLMSGFDWAVWVTISISAFGGLVVAVVIKFADNILKAFATSIAIILNCILAYFFFEFVPTPVFLAGAGVVILAVFIYSKYPFRPSHQPVPTKDDSIQDMKLSALEKGQPDDVKK